MLHPNEIVATRDQVAALLADQAPAWVDLPLERVRAAGTDHVLYRLGDALVVRLPRRAGAVAEQARQRRWLPTLAPGLPVPVPVPCFAGEPGAGYPWPWTVARWLPGAPPQPEPEPDALAVPLGLARDLAAFVRALWTRPVPAGAPPRGYRGESFADRDGFTRASLAACAALPAAAGLDLDAAERAWDDALCLPPAPPRRVWLHADLWAGNLLVEGGCLSGVLDFAPGVGQPSCELIVAWNLFGPAARAAFRSALGVDDVTWAHGRAWALAIALGQLAYYGASHAGMATNAQRTLRAVVAER